MALPSDMSTFLRASTDRLKLAEPASTVFAQSGAIIDAVTWIRDDDVVYVASGEAPQFGLTVESRAVARGRCTLIASLAAAPPSGLTLPGMPPLDAAESSTQMPEAAVVVIPNTFADLLTVASRELGINAKMVYTESGGLVRSVDVIQNNDLLFVSDAPRPKQLQRVLSVVSQRHDTAEGSDLCSVSDDGSVLTTQTAVVVSSAVCMPGPGSAPSLSAAALAYSSTDGGDGLLGSSPAVSMAPPPNSDWVSLNVGGQVFHTSRTTLCRDPDSMLARLFGRSQRDSGDGFEWSSATDASGAVLFDRDPRYFGPLLNYLRTGVLIRPDDVSLEGLLLEASFFQVTKLEELIASELEAEAASENSPYQKRYVVLTVKGAGVKLIEGPVDAVMKQLNGGVVPPRKPPFSVESDDLHTRVYGLTELGWLLKNFKLSEVLDALRAEGWVLVQSSAAYSSCSIGPGNISSKSDEDTEHLFIFAHKSGIYKIFNPK